MQSIDEVICHTWGLSSANSHVRWIILKKNTRFYGADHPNRNLLYVYQYSNNVLSRLCTQTCSRCVLNMSKWFLLQFFMEIHTPSPELSGTLTALYLPWAEFLSVFTEPNRITNKLVLVSRPEIKLILKKSDD